MVYAFERRRLEQIAGCLALAALAGLFWVVGASAPAEIAFFKWACWTASSCFCVLLFPVVQETLTPGPILVVGPDGITYRPLSREPVPWEEVAAIKRVRSPPRHDRDAGNPARDALWFEVCDISRVATRPGLAGAAMALGRSLSGGGTQIMNVRATTGELIAAFKCYWPGDIPIVTPMGRPYSSDGFD